MIQTIRGRQVTAKDLAGIYKYAMARADARAMLEQQTQSKLRRIVGAAGVRIVRRRAVA